MAGAGIEAARVLRGQGAGGTALVCSLVAEAVGKAGVTGGGRGPCVSRGGSWGGLRGRVRETYLGDGEVAEALLGVRGPVVRHDERDMPTRPVRTEGEVKVEAREEWEGVRGVGGSEAAVDAKTGTK